MTTDTMIDATHDTLVAAQSVLPGVIDLRRRIHANPELGNHLPETTAAVLDALAGLDLEIRESKETTSLIATLRGTGRGKGGGNGPRILLRGDMDALPMPEDNGLAFASRHENRMHACGHDAHTAMLAGAARVLHNCRDQFNGSVDFFFQTGEEGYFGAKVVIDEGLFDAPDAPDAVFAMHITPLLKSGVFTSRPGTLLAAADFWEIEICGKGGHASMPHDCLDPIPVACEIVQAMQHLVVSRINAFDPVVLTTTKITAGTTTNVIPETAKILGTLRSTSEKSRKIAHEGIQRLATGIAQAHDMTAQVTMNLGYPVTTNDPGFTDFARSTVHKLFGEVGWQEMATPMMGAEDFAYLLNKWPGAMVFLGVRPDDRSLAAPCHSNRMILNESAMAHGVALHAQIAIDYLALAAG